VKVLQLGVGSVGEVIARVLSAEPEIEAVVLADLDEERTARVAPMLPAGKPETIRLDVRDGGALRDALARVDLVVNGLVPEFNLDVMRACLEAGTHYLDMAAAGPRDVVGTAGVASSSR
jgi:saccharopine dehydrogenase (NAD+, L-lysine-forming)